METSELTVKVRSKLTITYWLLISTLKALRWLGLINGDHCQTIINYASNKGWLLKMKIGNSNKWEKIMFGVDL